METYQSAALNRSVASLLQQAVFYASLWAIGSSWAGAIREVALLLFPADSGNRIGAEVLYATLTTGIAVVSTLAATRLCTPTPRGRVGQTKLVGVVKRQQRQA